MAKSSRGRPDPPKSLVAATFQQGPGAAGLELNQLSAALAGVLDAGENPYGSAAQGRADEGNPPESGAMANDVCEISPRSILEAMLFVGSPNNEPLTSKQVAALMRGVRPMEIDALVVELNRDYSRRNCPYTIVAEGTGYRMVLGERFAGIRDQFYGKSRQARLSQAAIEVLAAVAYRGPITSEEVNRLRGTPSGHVLAQLVRRQLLKVEREETKPRRIRYRTAQRFLDLFGLASLEELPRGTDLEEP